MSNESQPPKPTRSFQEIATELRSQYAKSGSVDEATVRELFGDPMKPTIIRAIETKGGLR